MVTLAIEGSGGTELTYHLGKPTISVGASSQNDVVIRAPGVAPRHLVIQRNGNVFTFIGQNRQVVVLNGERRSRGVLRVGDRIRIGTATLIFKGMGEDEVEVVDVANDDEHSGGAEATPATVVSQRSTSVGRSRSEVVLYSEPHRLAEARQHMVEIFRTGIRSDLVPSLRTFMETFFADRQAMLAWLDEEGRFQPIVSQWTGEMLRLPVRTFEELGGGGRFALLRLGSRQILIYPVAGGALQSRAYMMLETGEEEQEDDELLLAELVRMLAIHWERVENSSSLYGPWESNSRAQIEEQLPGSSQATRVLRDSVLQAARSSYPVMLCGCTGAGRMTTAALIASMHPTGELPVHVFQARVDDEASARMELVRSTTEDGATGGSLVERARGGVLVVRDIHYLSQSLQREIAALIRNDLDSGYGPTVRWMATTEEDAMSLLNEGVLDSTLFNAFQQHLIRVPSLSERREDLPLLVVRLLNTVGAEQGKEIRGVELETLNSLLNHSFEGEMTELLGELRRLVSATPDGEMVRGIVPAVLRSVTGGEGTEDAEMATAAMLSQDDLKVVIPAVERLIIDRVLRRTKGNQSKAARILNLSRGALIAKMKEYEVLDYRYLRRK